MSLRIVDAELQLDQAFDLLKKTLTDWAGGKSDPWQKDGHGGVREEGASFARREDVYLFVSRDQNEVRVGAALTEKDLEIVRIEVPRKAPAKERKRAVFAAGDANDLHLMVSVEELKHQNIRDPFKRLAGAAQIKRANVSDRDYVLIGPLGDVKVADALLSLAALSPAFEHHVEKLGELAEKSDARETAEVYKVSPRIAGAHRVHAKVVEALFQQMRGAGFQIAELSNGPIHADFAVARSDAAIAFEIRADAELGDFLKALGQLVLVAPGGGAFRRALVLPAARRRPWRGAGAVRGGVPGDRRLGADVRFQGRTRSDLDANGARRPGA